MKKNLPLKNVLSEENTWDIIFTLIFAAISFSPVLIIIFETIVKLFNGNIELLKLSLPTGRRLNLFISTIGFSASVAVSGTILSILLGTFLYFLHNKASKFFTFLILIFTVVPSYIHALGWNGALFALNNLLKTLGFGSLPMQGYFISWWVQMMYLLPFGFTMVLLGFQSMDKKLIEAARILGNDMRTFCKVTIPLLLPCAAAASAFMMLISMMDYSIPSLFQVNLYSLEIFAQYSANYDNASAFLLALPLLCITIPITFIFQSSFRSLSLSTSRNQNAKVYLKLPLWFKFIQGIACTIFILQIAVPIITLLSSLGTLSKLPVLLVESSTEIKNTFNISIIAALISLPFIITAAKKIHEKKFLGSLWWILIIIPLTLPAPLIGIGLISTWNSNITSFLGIYGSIFMPVFAGLIRFMPFATIIMLSRLKSIDPLLMDAAKILQKNSFQTFFTIKIPLYAKSLLAALSIIFILTAAELGATVLVIPPGVGTLTIKIYNYMHYGKSDAVAGLCLIMLIFSMLAGGLLIKILNTSNLRR